MSTFPEAKAAAETFAGRTYSNSAEAMADLERIISGAILKRTAELATTLKTAQRAKENAAQRVQMLEERLNRISP